MPTPTTGEMKQTYLHFFINNSQRYCGLPGIFHTKIDNDIFAAIKSTVTESDIPAAERGETDRRFYGIELVDTHVLDQKLDKLMNQEMKSLVNGVTYKTTDMIAFIDLNIGTVDDKIDTLTAQVKALTEQVKALTAAK